MRRTRIGWKDDKDDKDDKDEKDEKDEKDRIRIGWVN